MGKYLPKLPFGTVAFEVVVDYSEDRKTMLKQSGRSWADPEGYYQFPLSGEGKPKRRLFAIPFFKNPFYVADALALVERLGLKPALAEDLLALVRDHYERIKKRQMMRILALGTVWQNPYSSAKQSSLFFGKNREWYSHDLSLRFNEGNWYLLAVAEDNTQRKIHKTPHPNLPYPQPTPYAPPTKEKFSDAIIPSLPNSGAVAVKVVVDYSKTAEQMVFAAGFKVLNTTSGIQGVPPLSSIPVGFGNPNPKAKPKVKRRLVFVRFSALEPDASNRTVIRILKMLEKHHLTPAKAEDFLSLSTEDRKLMREKFDMAYFAIFGTTWKYGEHQICLRTVDTDLYIGPANGDQLYSGSHWIPVFAETQKKPVK